MPSLRKRVTSYFRQLSFHNEPREKRLNVNENAFVTKYLQGLTKLRDGPPVLSGKTPTDLPNYDLGPYKTGSETIVGCYTGPNGGLTTVKRTEKHLSIPDDDIDFIDTQEDNASVKVKVPQTKKIESRAPIDNSTMVIKVAGQEYFVTNRKKQAKSQSLGSLSDLTAVQQNNNISGVKSLNEGANTIRERKMSIKSIENRPRSRNNSNKSKESRTNRDTTKHGIPQSKHTNELSKSRSEGNPFGHKKRGKIIRIEQRPASTVSAQSGTSSFESKVNDDLLLPYEWCKHSDHVFGLSDSLYDKNLVTKQKNGDPIADCFGIIARKDSAVLAVADGVNWGEKACIAAKSAVHGCLHYLNKTIFNDVKPFESLVKTDPKEIKSETPLHDNHMTNTQEVFVSLLRAFNCAHDLILENNGMLTTLTVAVILPLKEGSTRRSTEDNTTDESYVCCVCNVGDTLCYVYSPKYGIREMTKGSHDVLSNRDMRDALGALGPVDGTNPELSNLTLSVTKIQKGDIVLIASDGLTDNFDPNVCKFSVNRTAAPPTNHPVKPKRGPTVGPHPSEHRENRVSSQGGEKVENPVLGGRSPAGPLVGLGPSENRVSSQESEKVGGPISGGRSPAGPLVGLGPSENRVSSLESEKVGGPISGGRSPAGPLDKKIVQNRKSSQERKHPSEKNKPPVKPPRRNYVKGKGDNISRSSAERSSRSGSVESSKTKDVVDFKVKAPGETAKNKSQLIEQYLKENDPKANNTRMFPLCRTLSMDANEEKVIGVPQKYNFLRSKTSVEIRPKPVVHRNVDGLPYVTPIQRYELTLLLMEDILRNGISGRESGCVTARKLCESLMSFTFSITAAKRRTLEDNDMYFDNRNGVLVEASGLEKKVRRKRGLEKVQHLPGKLDHVTVVALNVGDFSITQ